MSFKKTITFTANASDYTDGTVSARVQAENKILGDFVTWILAQGLNIEQVEKVSIGDAKWTGQPFQVSGSGASDIQHTSQCTDLYFIGRGRNKKVIGLCIDTHVLRLALTDTPSRDLDFSASNNSYARIPAAMLRASDNASARTSAGAAAELATFGTQDDTITLTLAYWRGPSALVIIGISNNSGVVITREPYTCLYTAENNLKGLHFSLDDDFLISEATYAFTASNSQYGSNRALDYGTSYAPFFSHTSGFGMFERPYAEAYFPTCVLCHRLALLYGSVRSNDALALYEAPLNSASSMASTGALPGCAPYGFPRVGNSELYIRKMYVPMTRPAVTSPVKLGYTPGQIQQGAVYSVKGKYYVALKTGIVSYFVEVEDQGA